MAATRTRRIRPDLIVLVAVLVGVAILMATLASRMHQDRAAAAAAHYSQLTQSPQSIAVPTAAFIGDSYSAGTGSSGYNARFTTLVAAYEGWSSQSFAYGGTGYLASATTSAKTGCGADYCPRYREVLARVKAYNPTIVFVSGGRNDVAYPDKDVQAAIVNFYSELRAELPKARIIVTSPMWAYAKAPQQLSRIQAGVRAASAAAGATYLDLGEPLVSNRDLVATDRVHPNNRGHAEIARLAEVALSAAQKAEPSAAG